MNKYLYIPENLNSSGTIFWSFNSGRVVHAKSTIFLSIATNVCPLDLSVDDKLENSDQSIKYGSIPTLEFGGSIDINHADVDGVPERPVCIVF